jgi:KRAB domain-containing zinc finger protein
MKINKWLWFLGCLTAESLKRHMKIHDKNYVKKKHSCQICFQEFAYPSFLAEHMKNHTGEKPHLCSICGKGFRQSGALHYHQRVHTGYKPFVCKICNGNFMSQSVLKVHMRKHTNERPYVCHICGMAFRQSTDLKSHQRTHTGDKPVLCTICGKRMSTTGKPTLEFDCLTIRVFFKFHLKVGVEESTVNQHSCKNRTVSRHRSR